MKKRNILTIDELQYLFDNGVRIQQTWIMPPGEWEYSANPLGKWENPIAIKSTKRAAYNASIKWINKRNKNDTFS